MKFTKTATVLLCSALLFCGCTKNNDAAIKINDKVITKAQFNDDFNKIKNLQLKYLPDAFKKEDGYVVLSIKSKCVNDAIVRELLSQEFEKRKITASEEEIKAKKEKIIAQVGSKEAFEELLKKNGINDERLNSDLSSEVKTEKLINSLSNVKISDSDAEKFYKENKSDFTTPEKVQAFHILFNTNPEEIKRQIVAQDKDAKLSQADIDKKVKEEVSKMEALANEVRQKAIKNPKDFSKLAKEYSQDKGSAQNGGDLGYITKEQVVPEFGQMAFSQKVGSISPLVKTQYGTHIIYVKDKSAKQVQQFATVKADIKEFLSKKAKYDALNKLLTGLKSSAKIEYVDKSLDPANIEKQIKESMVREQQKQKENKAK